MTQNPTLCLALNFKNVWSHTSTIHNVWSHTSTIDNVWSHTSTIHNTQSQFCRSCISSHSQTDRLAQIWQDIFVFRSCRVHVSVMTPAALNGICRSSLHCLQAPRLGHYRIFMNLYQSSHHRHRRHHRHRSAPDADTNLTFITNTCLSVSGRGGPGSIPRQPMWDLWRTK